MLSNMKFAVAFALLSYLFAVVDGITTNGLNAQRLARGLPPLPPIRREPTPGGDGAGPKKPLPSGAPRCSSGAVQCCNSVTSSNDDLAKFIAGLLGIVLPSNTAVGLSCSPLQMVGVGKFSCSSQAVCCQNNSFNGAIAIGCTPINTHL